MKPSTAFMSGAGLGAGLLYLFDAQEGNRRRALMRDKLSHASRKLNLAVEKTYHDVSNRVEGLVSTLEAWQEEEDVSDEVLEERIRAKLGRIIRHPKSIQVNVAEGIVSLEGTILSDEVAGLLEAINRMSGVRMINNALDVHDKPDGVPGLQGGARHPESRLEVFQESWSPATRLLMGSAGVGLALYGLQQPSALKNALGVIGLGFLTRAATNRQLGEVVGLDWDRATVQIHKTITINAPVEKVYAAWSHYENFPRFMSHVRKVTAHEGHEEQSHWEVAGPAGIPVEWNAVITQQVPNRILAWKTMPGSVIGHAGRVVFSQRPQGGTSVSIQMSYHPALGGLGHLLASLVGADPKRQMDDDLVRMKTFLETGIQPHDAAASEPRRPRGGVGREG